MWELLRRVLEPKERAGLHPAPGLYHFSREVDGNPVRYHLRVERDGSGTIFANATSAARLSPTGVTIAHALLRDPVGGEARDAARAFRGATAAQVEEDLRRVRELIAEMPAASGRYPLRGSDDPESLAHRRTLSAPLSAHVVAGDVERGEAILRRLWDAGVPQVVLEVASARSCEGLVRLVEHAEDLGLIAGVSARASDVAGDVLDQLARAGLDHLDVGWAGPDPGVHDALFGEGDLAHAEETVTRCLALELCPVAVTPLVTSTVAILDELAADLASRRVGAWAVFAIGRTDDGDDEALDAGELRQAAATVEELADRFSLNLLWAPPVERDETLTLAEQARRGPRTTSEAAIRVEADGAVLAPVGPPRAVGDLLEGDWAALWSQPVFTRWREATDDEARCRACPGLAVCSAGCPAAPETWARSEGEPS